MSRVVPWSYSSQDGYNTCPRQFYEVRIAKSVKQEPSEAMLWGNEVHKALEMRAKEGTRIPKSMRHFELLTDKIINAPGKTYAEYKLACTKKLKPASFWDEDCWARGVGDLIKIRENGTHAAAFDWKTGKRKPNSKQLSLFALLVMANFPKVETCDTAFIWLKSPSNPTIGHYTKDDILDIMKQFVPTLKDMQHSDKEDVWPEKPSGLCYGWCPVTHCKHWRPKRERW